MTCFAKYVKERTVNKIPGVISICSLDYLSKLVLETLDQSIAKPKIESIFWFSQNPYARLPDILPEDHNKKR